MDIKSMMEYLRNTHYDIYDHAIINKEILSELDQALVLLSSNAFYELESLFLLVSNNKIHGTYSLCRNILEKFIYLRFILEKDSLDRAKDFRLSNFKLKLKIYEKTMDLYKGITPAYSPEEIKEMKSKYKYKKYLVSKDRNKWYVVKGVNSISGLFKYYNEDKFNYYYMKYSGEIHSSDSISKFSDMRKSKKSNKQHDNSEVVYIASEAFSEILNLIVKHYGLSNKFTSYEIKNAYTIKV